jgi:HSP20 family protein
MNQNPDALGSCQLRVPWERESGLDRSQTTRGDKNMKSVTMYRPNTLENALSDFDRYFGSLFGDSVMSPAARIYGRQPAVDVRETDKAYELEMELPGYDEKAIEVHVDGGKLTVASRAEESREEKKDESAFILRERRVNAFSRSFKLPENADSENISGEYKNGILKLEILKRAESRKRVIQINRTDKS